MSSKSNISSRQYMKLKREEKFGIVSLKKYSNLNPLPMVYMEEN